MVNKRKLSSQYLTDSESVITKYTGEILFNFKIITMTKVHKFTLARKYTVESVSALQKFVTELTVKYNS